MGWYSDKDIALLEPRAAPVVEAVPRKDPEITTDAAFTCFFLTEFTALRTGASSGSDFIAKLGGITDGVCGDMKREDAEAVFDQLLDESGGGLPAVAVLGLLAMMGNYDLSSGEREWVSTGYKYSAAGGARNTGAATGYWRQIAVPAPRRWCMHVVNELDVVAVLAMNLPDRFGWPGVRLMAKGLEEAVERLAHDKSFAWLRVAPLMQQVSATPDVTAAGERHKAFWDAVEQVLTLAQLQLETAAQVRDINDLSTLVFVLCGHGCTDRFRRGVRTSSAFFWIQKQAYPNRFMLTCGCTSR